ncbi:MAG TPA: hypothetical protein V6C89_06655 [Drouetiella sp.]
MIVALTLSQNSAPASDWVDGPVSVFQLPQRPAAPKHPPVESSAPAPDVPTMGVTDGHRPQSPHELEGGVSSTSVREDPSRQQQQPQQQGILANPYNEPPPPAGPPQTATVSPKLYSGWLSETHPDLAPMSKDSVLEVKGQWDDSGHALHNFGLNFTKISPGALAKTNLANTNVMIVDCAGEIPQASLGIIRSFVANGGYLITTDWSLDNCLARAIPGFVDWNSANSISELVDARTNNNPDATDNGDLLLNTVPRAYWKLDNKCQMVRVIKPDLVTVLVRSKRLEYQDPNRAFALSKNGNVRLDNTGILACTFRYEKGRVLHLVGHFDNNTDLAFNNSLPDPAPRIGISLRQAIAANFIAAALKANPHPLTKSK